MTHLNKRYVLFDLIFFFFINFRSIRKNVISVECFWFRGREEGQQNVDLMTVDWFYLDNLTKFLR